MNGVESLNGKFRDKCVNEHVFVSLERARQEVEIWRQDYNANRPHSSLRKNFQLCSTGNRRSSEWGEVTTN
jgi:transposase InsO family protein